MFLALMLFLAMCAVAGSAAFFSVIGLAKLFSGAFIPVVIMGTSLEFGKIVATSFLYNYWEKTSIFLRVISIFIISILVCVTSMGVSGFLISAYQTSTISITQDQESLKILETQLQTYKDRKLVIDKQIQSVGDNYVTAKQRLMQSFEKELAQLGVDIPTIESQILDIKTKNVEANAKIGAVIFITDVLGISDGKSVLFFVLILVIVFDPFAIVLTILFNKVMKDRKKSSQTEVIPSDLIVDVKQRALHNYNSESTI